MRAWVGGSFDLFHPGHVHLLRQAKQHASFVTVAVNDSDFVGRFKTPPAQTTAERLEVVSAIRYVDDTQVNYGDRQRDLILEAQADLIVVGDDWAPPKEYLAQIDVTQGWLDSHGIRVVYVPRAFITSTTDLKRRVRS